MDGNLKPGKSQRKYIITCVVTHSSYSNALHYGLLKFAEFEGLSYVSLISISVRFHKSLQ